MKNIIKDRIFKSIIILFILGIIFGSIFVFVVKDSEQELIYKGIEEYIEIINNSNISVKNFFNSFSNYFILINLIYISSFAFIFFPVIYFINFYKGFSIGFLFTSLLVNYKLRGIKYALTFLFPHEYIFILFMMLISLYGLKNALKLYYLYKDDKAIKVKKLYNKFSVVYISTILITSLISLLEVFINYRIVSLLF